MAGTDWKWEASRTACMRCWQGRREKYHQQGLTAPDGAGCPYPSTSFAALHWTLGAAQRSQ